MIIKMRTDLYVENSHSCPIVIKFAFSAQFFEKYSNIKFH